MPLLFALTMFVGAVLLFAVQPMIARMILPLLGGSPVVWNTCMVFFQATLLAGYAYGHATTSWFGTRRQAVLHVGIMLLPFLVLPLVIAPEAVHSLPSHSNPMPWLIGVLLISVGLPFFVVSTTAPLLQKWFASTGHPSAIDPYWLYGASNFGSMLALLSYPLVIEPNLRLSRQSGLWASGYLVLVVLTLICAVVLWLSPRTAPQEISADFAPTQPASIGAGRRLRWVALAFVPSSLMLGLTTYLSTDIAPIPLLWVIPLALYLLTFILVSARRPLLPHAWMCRLLPLGAAITLLVLLFQATGPVWFLVLMHLAMFFVAAMVCHGELLNDRPPARNLTEFYLWMSVGGVLGGLFNAMVAPMVFDGVVEYPLAIVLATLFRPGTSAGEGESRARKLDLLLPLGIGMLTVALVLGGQALGLKADRVGGSIMFGIPVLLWYSTLHRPIRFGLGLGTIMMASVLAHGVYGRSLYRERNFFGAVQVTETPDGRFHQLIHGSTIHGRQNLDPNLRREPLSYYYRNGPIGQLLKVFCERPGRPNVAIVGLGAGSLATYAEPSQAWTMYEIDPAIERIARDPRYFTFFRDSRAGSLDVVLGDARLQLRDAPEHGYGLIVLDAFSSDAIPMHLLTREALRLYLEKLAEGGMIGFHISNRYVDLAPVLGALARDAKLACRVRYDLTLTPEEQQAGKECSTGVVMAVRDEDLGVLARDPSWQVPQLRTHESVWTDDFSNIIEHFILRPR